MADGFREPAYGERSLGDVVPAAAAALGHPLGDPPTGLDLPDAASYVVFLIDGLGANLLQRHADAAPYLSSLLARSAPGTAGVPSTTSTSLTSLGTGMTPGGHGLVGFTTRVPGTDQLLNHLLWDAEVDPKEWQPHPTAFARLQASGVQVSVVNKREFNGTGLTTAAHRGADYVGVDRVGERIAAVVGASGGRPGQTSLTYVYDGDLDWTGHRWGVASSQWLQQLSMIDHEAEQLRGRPP
ncbi:alkaline phosphatase family protein [Nocardioides sp. TF02-7]|uniref:alkaline phosphatase family protein n=1 Tax=Nocardioides sp. TF02-7 TaxID=2917724 RepID=UPI001F0650BD|nr:alkaline phosphatase family protein [Nocardioides sp. TF02-7]UMG92784.1 alkaline phosphatase family protein [Nocardioides sp. TF02-7]